jgi:hypothetical protein
MPENLASWPRPHFQPGGGDAFLFYKVHGSFSSSPQVSRSRHRCAGVPHDCHLSIHRGDTASDLLRLGLDEGYIADGFRREDPALFEAVSSTDQCVVLRGDVADPATLDYFRDAVGLVTAVLESGGVAVFDPQMFKWWTPEEWRERAFEPAGPVPRHHVVILVSEEPGADLRWYHTRGMRKFGRPDLSIHHVPFDLREAVEDLCNRFVEMQAFGSVIPEGQEIRMKSLPEGWICRHGGDVEDPDFNNVHVEIGPA